MLSVPLTLLAFFCSDIHLRIDKSARTLTVFDGSKPIHVYPSAFGNPDGPKRKQGDMRTPEGTYKVVSLNANSRFYKSFLISYPNTADADAALADGIIDKRMRDAIARSQKLYGTPPQKTGMGGDICIHGGSTDYDWTAGCIALSNDHIDSLWKWVKPGTRVEIVRGDSVPVRKSPLDYFATKLDSATLQAIRRQADTLRVPF